MRLSHITLDERFQLRTSLDGDLVRSYADAMREGDVFPPLTVALLDGTLTLIDGWHRYHAMLDVHGPSHDVTLDNIGVVDVARALDEAIARNRAHGAQWNAGDRRRAALLLLEQHPELSSREVARRVSVSPSSVEAWRRGGVTGPRTVTRADGTQYQWRAKPALHDVAREVVQRHGVDDAQTVAIVDELARAGSTLIEELTASGGVYVRDAFVSLHAGPDDLRRAIADRRNESRSVAMQARAVDVRIMRVMVGASLPDVVRAVARVERDDVGRAYAWLRGSGAYLCDVTAADGGACWWCFVRGNGALFRYEDFIQQMGGDND